MRVLLNSNPATPDQADRMTASNAVARDPLQAQRKGFRVQGFMKLCMSVYCLSTWTRGPGDVEKMSCITSLLWFCVLKNARRPCSTYPSTLFGFWALLHKVTNNKKGSHLVKSLLGYQECRECPSKHQLEPSANGQSAGGESMRIHIRSQTSMWGTLAFSILHECHVYPPGCMMSRVLWKLGQLPRFPLSILRNLTAAADFSLNTSRTGPCRGLRDKGIIIWTRSPHACWSFVGRQDESLEQPLRAYTPEV